MGPLIVHQTLHGYRDGHRLLAASVELGSEERQNLDLLSDQSGTAERHIDYEHYDTGYPAGRWYVVARTWVDRGAVRRGTVWTHSLLVPIGQLDELGVPGRLVPLFRRPAHRDEAPHYEQALTLPPPVAPPALTEAHAAAWFFQDERPLIWEDPTTAAMAVDALWARLPPFSRPRFRYCTFSIQPRYHADSLLDWQCAAPEVAGWYRVRERLTRPPPAQTPGIELLTRDADRVAQMWATSGLPPTAEGRHLRVWLRLQTLAARSDHAASLARLDCVEALGPGPWSAPAVRAAIRSLQHVAEPTSPLLRDVIIRAPHRLAPEEEGAVVDAVRAALRRLPTFPSGELIRAAQQVGLGGLIEETIQLAACRLPAAELAARVATEPVLAERLERVLEVHPSGAVAAALLAGDTSPWSDQAWAWLLGAWPRVLSAAKEGLSASLTARVLLSDVQASATQWQELLGLLSLDADALEEVPRGQRSRVVDRLRLLPVTRQSQLPPPWRLEALLATARQEAQRLVRSPELAAEILLAHPQAPWSDDLERELRSAVALEDRVDLISVELLPEAPWSRRWAAGVVEGVLPAYLRGEHLLDTTLAWIQASGDPLADHAVMRLLARPPARGLAHATRLAAALKVRWTGGALRDLWEGWTRHDDVSIVSAIDGWVALLRALPRRDDLTGEAHTRAFLRALSGRHAGLGELAAVAFPAVHDAVRLGEKGLSFLTWLSALWDKDWDRAKHVRRAVTDAWVRQGWSDESLRDMANGDAHLFGKLCERVAEAPEGRRRLLALRQDLLPPDLLRELRGVLVPSERR